MDLLDLLGISKQKDESIPSFDNAAYNNVIPILALSSFSSSEPASKEITNSIFKLSTDIPGLSDQTILAIACLERLNSASYKNHQSIRNELFGIIKGLKTGAPLLPAILPHIQTQILAKDDPEVIVKEIAWIEPLFGSDAVIAPLMLKAVQEPAPTWLLNLIKQFDVARTTEHLSRICTPPFLKDPISVATLCSTLREMANMCDSRKKNAVLTKLASTCLNQMGGVVDPSLPSELTAILRLLPKTDALKPALQPHLLRHLNQILTTLDAKTLSAELKWMGRFLDRQIIDNHICEAVASGNLPSEMLFLTQTPLSNEHRALLQKHLNDQRQIAPPMRPLSELKVSEHQSSPDIPLKPTKCLIVANSAFKNLDHIKHHKSKDQYPDIKNTSNQNRRSSTQDDITFLQKRVGQRSHRNKNFEETAIAAMNSYAQCKSFHPPKMLEILTDWYNSFNSITPEKESWCGLGKVLLTSIERTGLASFNSEYNRLRFLAAPVAKSMIAAYPGNALPDDAILCVAQLLQNFLAVAPSNYPNRSEVITLALNIVLPHLCDSKNSSDWVIAEQILESFGGSDKRQVTFFLTLASHWIGKKTTEPALKILQAQQNNYTTKQHKRQATIHRIACAQLLQEKGHHDQAIETLKGVSLHTAEGLILMAKVGSLCIRSFCAKSQYLQAAQVFRDLSVIRLHADVQAELKGQLPAILDALLGIGTHDTLSLALTLMTTFNHHTSDYWTRWWTALAKSLNVELINRGWDSFHNIELAEQENWDDCLKIVFEVMATPKRIKILLDRDRQSSLLNLCDKIKSDDVCNSCLADILKVGLLHAKTLPTNQRRSLLAFLVNLYAQKNHPLIGKEDIERQIILALLNLSPKEIYLEVTALTVICLENSSKSPSKDEEEAIQRLLDPIFDRVLEIGRIPDDFLGAINKSNLSFYYIATKARAFSNHEDLALSGMYLLSMILKKANGPLSVNAHALILSMFEDLINSGNYILMERCVIYLCAAFANPASDRNQWVPTTKTLLNRLLVAAELRGSFGTEALQTLGNVTRVLSKYLNLSDLTLIADMSDCLIHHAQNDPNRQAFPTKVFNPLCESLGWPTLYQINQSVNPNPTVIQQCLVLTAKIVEQLSKQHLHIDELWIDMLYRCLMTLSLECRHTHSELILQALYILLIRTSEKTGKSRNVNLLAKWGSQMPPKLLTTLRNAHQIKKDDLHESLNLLSTSNATNLLIALCTSLHRQGQQSLLLSSFCTILQALPKLPPADQTYNLRRLLALTVDVSISTYQELKLSEKSKMMAGKLFNTAAVLLNATPNDPELFKAAADILFGLSDGLPDGAIRMSWNFLLSELIRSSTKVCHHRSTLFSLVDIISAMNDANLSVNTAKAYVEQLQTALSGSAHPLAKIARLVVFQEAYNFGWCLNADEYTNCARETWETSLVELMTLPVGNLAYELQAATQLVQASLHLAFDTPQCRTKNVQPATITAWFEQWCSKTGEILAGYQQTSEIDGPSKDLLQFMRSIHISLTNFIDVSAPPEIKPIYAELWLVQLKKKQGLEDNHGLKAEIFRDSLAAWTQIMQDKWKPQKQSNR